MYVLEPLQRERFPGLNMHEQFSFHSAFSVLPLSCWPRSWFLLTSSSKPAKQWREGFCLEACYSEGQNEPYHPKLALGALVSKLYIEPERCLMQCITVLPTDKYLVNTEDLVSTSKFKQDMHFLKWLTIGINLHYFGFLFPAESTPN